MKVKYVQEWVPFSNFTNIYGLEMSLLPFYPDEGASFALLYQKTEVTSSEKISWSKMTFFPFLNNV